MRTSGRSELWNNLEVLCSPKRRFEIRTEYVWWDRPTHVVSTGAQIYVYIHFKIRQPENVNSMSYQSSHRKKFLTIWQKKPNLQPSQPPLPQKKQTTFLEDVFFLFQDFLQQKHLHLPRKNHRHRTSFQQPPGGPPAGAPPGGPPGGGGYHGAPPPHGGWEMMGF